jgi:predicted GNAT family acetyltransferase
VNILATGDPQRCLDGAGGFLEADPVRHNVILTLLQTRVAFPDVGSYWTVVHDGAPVGVVFHSPDRYPALVTPMSDAAVVAAVDAIVEAGHGLPGVTGDAATASRFAGEWTERRKSAAAPDQGQRIYEVDEVVPAAPIPGALRRAAAPDRDLVVKWFTAFGAEIGEPGGDIAAGADRRIELGQVWLWDDGRPVSVAALTHPVAGVVRVGPVYTPPDARGRGYASAVVGALSAGARARGRRCILFTDLENPTSNSIYRALGYRAVAEVLRYRFDPPKG